MLRLLGMMLASFGMLSATVNAQFAPAPANQANMDATVLTDDMVPASELEAALAELETAHAQNYNTLLSVLERVPESARPVLEQAMENSKRGWQKARDNRERQTLQRQARAQARSGFGSRPETIGQRAVPTGQNPAAQNPTPGNAAGNGQRGPQRR